MLGAHFPSLFIKEEAYKDNMFKSAGFFMSGAIHFSGMWCPSTYYYGHLKGSKALAEKRQSISTQDRIFFWKVFLVNNPH